MTFPLAIRYGFSSYTNELVLFLKGTAAIGAITMLDLLAVASIAAVDHIRSVYTACLRRLHLLGDGADSA